MKYKILGEIQRGKSVTDLAAIIYDMADLDDGRVYQFRCHDGKHAFVVQGGDLDVENIEEYGVFYCDGQPVIVDEISYVTVLREES